MKKLSRAALHRRAKPIKLIAMDVDGVLTAGDIVILESGEEIKFWSSKDRYLMAMLRKMANPPILAWITGRSSKAVARAASEFDIPHVVQGCKDKKEAFFEIVKHNNLNPKEAAFIGDDLIDLAALRAAGLSACPCDAVPEVVDQVDFVSTVAGGKGVFRDVVKLILESQKRWEPFVASLQD